VVNASVSYDPEFIVYDSKSIHSIKKPDIFKRGIMKHLIGRVNGVCIETIDQLEPLMEQIADECALTVVSRAFHQFDPVGVTGVLVLSESHFSVHTYPENDSVYLDIFCCSETFDPEKSGRVILRVLEATSADWQVVVR
jgi:S-adenosylmethionine decarboxylase proenzyme